MLSPSRCETATSAIVATSQTARTTNRRRTQNCASPYSTPVMAGRFPLKVAFGRCILRVHEAGLKRFLTFSKTAAIP